MKSVLNVDDDVLAKHDIVIRKNKPVLAILLFIVGVLLFFLSFMLDNQPNMSTILLSGAFSLAVSGSALLLYRSYQIACLSTGEVYHKYICYFGLGQDDQMEKLLHRGDFEAVKKASTDNSTLPLMLTLYLTDDGKRAMYQIFKYVPHTYEPITDVQFFNK